jgi:DNA-binding transcriptional MerR regulator
MSNSFTSREAYEITRVTQRCLDYWDLKGVVSPTERRASGKGSERRYTRGDLLLLMMVKKLRTCGLSLQKIDEALKKLRKKSGQTGNEVILQQVLFSDGTTLHRMTNDPTTAEDVLSDGQLVFSLVVRSVEKELTEKIQVLEGRIRRRGRPRESA